MPALDEKTGLKECSKCHIEKSAQSFSKDAKRKDGLNPWCRDCKNFCRRERNRKRNPPAFDSDSNTKKCSKCGERKDVANFTKRSASKDGLHYWCKSCVKFFSDVEWLEGRLESQKKYAEKNRDRIDARRKAYQQTEEYKELQKTYYTKDPERYRGYTNKRRIIKEQACVEGEPTPTTSGLRFRDGDCCYYCKDVLDFEVQVGRKFSNSAATVEHLIPLFKGGKHTYENTVLSCRKCNSQKGAKTEEEYYEYLKNIEKNEKIIEYTDLN